MSGFPYDRVMDCDLALVIVTYNSVEILPTLLESVPGAVAGLRVEVVVVDNGSSDGTQALVEGRSDCRLVRSTNLGYAAGINRGFAASTAPAVLVLNPDVVLGPGSVPPLLARLNDHGAGVVVPQVLEADGRLSWSLRREPTLLRALGLSRSGVPALAEYVMSAEDYRHPVVVSWALGAAMLIARPCFDELDGWDESYFLYSEETDFCLRAADFGWLTWYEPMSTVTHIGGLSGRNDVTHVMQVINRVRLYVRRHGRLRGWIYYGLTILAEVSWILRGHRQSVAAVRALWLPSTRPIELACRASRLPR